MLFFFMIVQATGEKGDKVHSWKKKFWSVLFEAVGAKVNAWEVGWAPELIAVRRKTEEEGGRRRNRRTSGRGIVRWRPGCQIIEST